MNTHGAVTPPRLATPGSIHLWVVDLDVPTGRRESLAQVLAPDELARAERFVFREDRDRYVACRGSVRQILGGYLDVDAARLAFTYGRRGKPALDSSGLEFNVSHAAGLALLAVTGGAAVGVDVEHVRRPVHVEDLADRFFSAQEADELLSLPQSQRRSAFFRCWTRKEAYVKAIGEGLSCPFDSFAVTFSADEPAAFRWIEGHDARQWGLRAFEPAPGYVAAVASRSESAMVLCRSFEERS